MTAVWNIRPCGTYLHSATTEYGGGSTTFLSHDGSPGVDVHGEPGMVLVFQHDMLHEGAAVESGVKYVMRTDVMFTATGSRSSCAQM